MVQPRKGAPSLASGLVSTLIIAPIMLAASSIFPQLAWLALLIALVGVFPLSIGLGRFLRHLEDAALVQTYGVEAARPGLD